MINVLELIALFAGFLGVFYSAHGLRGLFIWRNAKAVIMLADSLGRLDFHWSEGQFDMILNWIYDELLIALGAVFLLISLVLSSVANPCNICLFKVDGVFFQIILRVGAVLLGIILGWCTLPLLRKCAIAYAAKEIERRASDSIKINLGMKERTVRQLNTWFKRRVGRDPDVDC